MAYTPTIWKDGQAPALNAENLNKIEQGIANAAQAIEAMTDPMGSWKYAGKLTENNKEIIFENASINDFNEFVVKLNRLEIENKQADTRSVDFYVYLISEIANSAGIKSQTGGSVVNIYEKNTNETFITVSPDVVCKKGIFRSFKTYCGANPSTQNKISEFSLFTYFSNKEMRMTKFEYGDYKSTGKFTLSTSANVNNRRITEYDVDVWYR